MIVNWLMICFSDDDMKFKNKSGTIIKLKKKTIINDERI